LFPSGCGPFTVSTVTFLFNCRLVGHPSPLGPLEKSAPCSLCHSIAGRVLEAYCPHCTISLNPPGKGALGSCSFPELYIEIHLRMPLLSDSSSLPGSCPPDKSNSLSSPPLPSSSNPEIFRQVEGGWQ
jgi:hypothetical protein